MDAHLRTLLVRLISLRFPSPATLTEPFPSPASPSRLYRMYPPRREHLLHDPWQGPVVQSQRETCRPLPLRAVGEEIREVLSQRDLVAKGYRRGFDEANYVGESRRVRFPPLPSILSTIRVDAASPRCRRSFSTLVRGQIIGAFCLSTKGEQGALLPSLPFLLISSPHHFLPFAVLTTPILSQEVPSLLSSTPSVSSKRARRSGRIFRSRRRYVWSQFLPSPLLTTISCRVCASSRPSPASSASTSSSASFAPPATLRRLRRRGRSLFPTLKSWRGRSSPCALLSLSFSPSVCLLTDEADPPRTLQENKVADWPAFDGGAYRMAYYVCVCSSSSFSHFLPLVAHPRRPFSVLPTPKSQRLTFRSSACPTGRPTPPSPTSHRSASVLPLPTSRRLVTSSFSATSNMPRRRPDRTIRRRS